MRTIHPEEPSMFLTADQVPPNLTRIKPDTYAADGTTLLKANTLLRWAPGVVPMSVVRAGYRLSAKDCLKDAAALLDTNEGRTASLALLNLVVASSPPAFSLRKNVHNIPDLRYAIARALAAQRRLGGPERGLHVRPLGDTAGLLGRGTADTFSAVSTRCVRLGTYYPPTGGYSHDGEYDGEDGGLSNPRTVVLVNIGAGIEVVSGWLTKIAKETA